MPALPRRSFVALALAAVLAAGASACSVDLDQVGSQVQDAVDGARGALDDVEQAVQDAAGLDDAARAGLDDAVTQAEGAIAEARSAIEQGADAETVQSAQEALAQARAAVEEAAATAPSTVGPALDALASQIDDLVARLTPSS